MSIANTLTQGGMTELGAKPLEHPNASCTLPINVKNELNSNCEENDLESD